MKILLLGPNGQVGWELQRSLQPLGDVLVLGRQRGDLCGDLGRPAELAATVRALKPDVIVNAAAYTAVDKAEAEPELARLINSEAPGMLAAEAASSGAWLLHFSTDYVFDGTGRNAWREDDPSGPQSAYGRSKLSGEQAIRASGCRHLIIRTSWVYAARGANFARTMLKLAQEREQLKVVSDQIGAPTGAELLADIGAHMLKAAVRRPELSGVYHCAAGGETSWHDYARYVIELARARGMSIRVAPGDILPIATQDYPTPARRPLNSRLNCSKLQAAFNVHLPSWQLGVERVVAEWLPA